MVSPSRATRSPKRVSLPVFTSLDVAVLIFGSLFTGADDCERSFELPFSSVFGVPMSTTSFHFGLGTSCEDYSLGVDIIIALLVFWRRNTGTTIKAIIHAPF